MSRELSNADRNSIYTTCWFGERISIWLEWKSGELSEGTIFDEPVNELQRKACIAPDVCLREQIHRISPVPERNGTSAHAALGKNCIMT